MSRIMDWTRSATWRDGYGVCSDLENVLAWVRDAGGSVREAVECADAIANDFPDGEYEGRADDMAFVSWVRAALAERLVA